MDNSILDPKTIEILKFFDISVQTFDNCVSKLSKTYLTPTDTIRDVLYKYTIKIFKLLVVISGGNINISGIEYILSPSRINSILKEYNGVYDGSGYVFDNTVFKKLSNDLIVHDKIMLVSEEEMGIFSSLPKIEEVYAPSHLPTPPPSVSPKLKEYTVLDLNKRNLLPKSLTDASLKRFIKGYSNLQDFKIPPGQKYPAQILYLFGVHIGYTTPKEFGEHSVYYPGQHSEVYIFGPKEYIEDYILDYSQTKSKYHSQFSRIIRINDTSAYRKES